MNRILKLKKTKLKYYKHNFKFVKVIVNARVLALKNDITYYEYNCTHCNIVLTCCYFKDKQFHRKHFCYNLSIGYVNGAENDCYLKCSEVMIKSILE